MGIVAFITMGAVMLFLPLGIIKGLVQKFLLTEGSAFYTISVNVILHAVGISLICFGGYYCSQENLIQYSFATTTNFSLPSHTSLKLSFLSSCLSLR